MNTWYHITVYKFLVFEAIIFYYGFLSSVTWRHLIGCKQMIIIKYIIHLKPYTLYKILDKNSWNHPTLCKLFVFHRKSWYHITVPKRFL